MAIITPLDIDRLFAIAEQACYQEAAKIENAVMRHRAMERNKEARQAFNKANRTRELAELCNKLRYQTANDEFIEFLKKHELAEVEDDT